VTVGGVVIELDTGVTCERTVLSSDGDKFDSLSAKSLALVMLGGHNNLDISDSNTDGTF
jgi:hypothetical protein